MARFSLNIINFNNDIGYTNDDSVGKTVDKKSLVNHAPERAAVLPDIREKCKLFKDFETGNRKLSHNELYGLATNLIQIETGTKIFIDIRERNPDFYSAQKNIKWKYDLSFMKQNNYKSQRCDNYCPYHDQCIHGKNIISTAHIRRGVMEKISGYQEIFYSMEEMQDDTYEAINRAYRADDKQFQIVKSMTAAGKSTSYLKLMSEHPEDRFLIAAPTNLLKDEIYEKARKMGIKVMKTPSLEQIKDEMPDDVWHNINKLYTGGRHRSVHPYIYEMLKKKKIPCLNEYMDEREKLRSFKGSVITTHRYLLNMQIKRMNEKNTHFYAFFVIFYQ